MGKGSWNLVIGVVLGRKETSLRRLFEGGKIRGPFQPGGRRGPRQGPWEEHQEPAGLALNPIGWQGWREAGLVLQEPRCQGDRRQNAGQTGALGPGSPVSVPGGVVAKPLASSCPFPCSALQMCSSGPTTRWFTGSSPLGCGIMQETCRRAACMVPCWPWMRTLTTTRWPWSSRSPRRIPRWASLSSVSLNLRPPLCPTLQLSPAHTHGFMDLLGDCLRACLRGESPCPQTSKWSQCTTKPPREPGSFT